MFNPVECVTVFLQFFMGAIYISVILVAGIIFAKYAEALLRWVSGR